MIEVLVALLVAVLGVVAAVFAGRRSARGRHQGAGAVAAEKKLDASTEAKVEVIEKKTVDALSKPEPTTDDASDLIRRIGK